MFIPLIVILVTNISNLKNSKTLSKFVYLTNAEHITLSRIHCFYLCSFSKLLIFRHWILFRKLAIRHIYLHLSLKLQNAFRKYHTIKIFMHLFKVLLVKGCNDRLYVFMLTPKEDKQIHICLTKVSKCLSLPISGYLQEASG